MIHFHRSRTLLACTTIAAAAASGCGSETPSQAANTAAAERTRVNVTVQKLTTRQLTERIELSGELEPWVEVRVASELGGTVEHVGFEKGERVTQGQLLARIGTDLFQAGLDEAEARLEAAEAIFEKTQALFDRKHVPRQELITARSAFNAAEAQVVQARLRLERSIIEAPIAGVAVTRNLEPGEVLAPGAPVTVLHRVDRLKAAAGIPENDIAAFRVGGEASIRVDAYPDREFPGRIHFIGAAAEDPTRTFPAEIAVANPGGRLRPGMIARVALVKRRYEDAVVVSRDALEERDTGPVALVLDGEVARVRELVIGAREGNNVLVREGLAPGEWLIVTGQRGLVEGQGVEVVERRP
jgi:membrane fusion protein (multidrug efflux system)